MAFQPFGFTQPQRFGSGPFNSSGVTTGDIMDSIYSGAKNSFINSGFKPIGFGQDPIVQRGMQGAGIVGPGLRGGVMSMAEGGSFGEGFKQNFGGKGLKGLLIKGLMSMFGG